MGGEVERVKREDCSKIKQGPGFSPWKVLVGPSDWENHSSGVCGAEKYRTQNLPLGGMGVYELGVAITSSKGGHSVRDLNPGCVITVYTGIADNVRTRLQEYGRNGSHLDGGKSMNLPHENEGRGLFKDVFSKGFSIVFRWALMKSKKEAEETEARLLKGFDYAWNRGGNGARRPHEIIPMLDRNKIISRKTRSCDALTKCRASTLQINGTLPSEDSEVGPNHLKLPGLQVTMISRSRPQLVSGRFVVDKQYICGVIMGSGLSCTNIPIEGNKRCIDHKGQRVHGSFSMSFEAKTSGGGHQDWEFCASKSQRQSKPWAYSIDSVYEENYDICGVSIGNGFYCRNRPPSRRKRCDAHKGQRLYGSYSSSVMVDYGDFSGVCGVTMRNGSTCMSSPGHGGKRCGRHKGMRA